MRTSTMIQALGLVLSLGVAGVASAQSGQPPRSEGANGWRRGSGDGGERYLLNGINLTPQQQRRLEQIRQERRNEMQANRERYQKMMADARAAHERGDAAAERARREEGRAEMQRQRDRHMAAMRGLLTNEQQRRFDANAAEWRKHAEHRHDGRR